MIGAVTLTAEVAKAIEELEATFPEASVTVDSTGDGGAWVLIDSVDVGPVFVGRASWLRFQIPFTYPAADIYPMFVRPDLSRVGGEPLGEALTAGHGCGPDGLTQAVQVSRRTNAVDAATHTAAGKVLKVLQWLRNR